MGTGVAVLDCWSGRVVIDVVVAVVVAKLVPEKEKVHTLMQ